MAYVFVAIFLVVQQVLGKIFLKYLKVGDSYFQYFLVKASPVLDNLVVGGRKADYGDFPYQASVQNATGHVCGGAIINEYHVLTAARCVG